jgi:CheY-like chemotaxis protein
LLVDDDSDHRRVLTRVLARHYRVTEVSTAELALDLVLGGREYDVILCDMCLDGWSGGDLYRRLARVGDPHASRFVMFSGTDVRTRHPALAAELGDRLLQKPLDGAIMIRVLRTTRSVAAVAAATRKALAPRSN